MTPTIQTVKVNINKNPKISTHISNNTLKLKSDVSFNVSNAKEYEGSYYVIPRTTEQILPTKNKLMTEDLEVEKILLHESDNEYGITLTIGE